MPGKAALAGGDRPGHTYSRPMPKEEKRHTAPQAKSGDSGPDKGTAGTRSGKALPFGTAVIAPYLDKEPEAHGRKLSKKDALEIFRKEFKIPEHWDDERAQALRDRVHKSLKEALGIPDDVEIATVKDALLFQSEMVKMGYEPDKNNWHHYSEGKGAKALEDAVRATFDIPKDVPIDAGRAVEFAANMQEVGGELDEHAWQKFGQGKGDEVLGDAIRSAVGIPNKGTEGMSAGELAGLAAGAEQIGVDTITQGFISDWKAVQSGTMSAEDMIKKHAGLGDDSSLTGSGGGNNSSSQGSSGSSHLPNGLGSHDHGQGTGSGGSHSNSSGNGSVPPPVTGENDQHNSNQNSDSSPPLTGMNSGSNTGGDNSTRTIDPGGEVIDIKIEIDRGDNTTTGSSDSPSSTPSSSGPDSFGDTSGNGSGGNGEPRGHFSDEADQLRENNDMGDDAGVFTVETYGSETEPDSVQAGVTGDVYDDKEDTQTGYAQNDSGVIVGWGMNGPSSDSDDNSGAGSSGSNGGSNDDGSSGSGGDDDNGSAGSSDNGGSSGGSDDGGGSSSGGDDGGSSSGSDDGGSSSGSDDGNSSGSSSDDDDSSDDSAYRNPMADEQPSGPVDLTGLFETHAGQTGITNPAGAEGSRNVDTSQIKPHWRHGLEEVIHTTGEEGTGESPIQVSDSMGSGPSGDRSGIEMPAGEEGQVTPGSDPLGERGNPHNNPGAGDPRADDD